MGLSRRSAGGLDKALPRGASASVLVARLSGIQAMDETVIARPAGRMTSKEA
jgi:hypothetical protein